MLRFVILALVVLAHTTPATCDPKICHSNDLNSHEPCDGGCARLQYTYVSLAWHKWLTDSGYVFRSALMLSWNTTATVLVVACNRTNCPIFTDTHFNFGAGKKVYSDSARIIHHQLMGDSIISCDTVDPDGGATYVAGCHEQYCFMITFSGEVNIFSPLHRPDMHQISKYDSYKKRYATHAFDILSPIVDMVNDMIDGVVYFFDHIAGLPSMIWSWITFCFHFSFSGEWLAYFVTLDVFGILRQLVFLPAWRVVIFLIGKIWCIILDLVGCSHLEDFLFVLDSCRTVEFQLLALYLHVVYGKLSLTIMVTLVAIFVVIAKMLL